MDLQSPIYEVRKAILKDALDIANVHLKCWQETYSALLGQSFLNKRTCVYYLEKYEQRLKNEKRLCLIALSQGKIIGFCTAAPLEFHNNQSFSSTQLEELRNNKGEIDNLYLLKKFQGIGVGRMLLAKASLWLEMNHLSPFLIWTLKNNLDARKFYESQGGKLVAEVLTRIGENKYPEVAYRFV
jgi:ribosomal protein S18 acetylase RimI-like enzyme